MGNKKQFLPTNDYVFTKIFGKKGNEDITSDLIEKITGTKYEDINLETTPILERDLIENKKGILDVKVVANNCDNIDIEMQVSRSSYIADRILWYWSKMYSASIEKGDSYDTTKRAICILIADFEIERFKNIKKFRTKWNIREEQYSNIILTNKLEIIIIELTKLDKIVNKNIEDIELIKWCKFIKNPEKESSIMEENKYIKRAKEELDKINQDEYERRMAELREKAILDDIALRKTGFIEGKAEGKEEGRKEGRKEGIKEGRLESKKEIAKNMLNESIDIDLIEKLTGLTKEEIEGI